VKSTSKKCKFCHRMQFREHLCERCYTNSRRLVHSGLSSWSAVRSCKSWKDIRRILIVKFATRKEMQCRRNCIVEIGNILYEMEHSKLWTGRPESPQGSAASPVENVDVYQNHTLG